MPNPLSDRMAAQAAAWDAGGDGRAVFLDCYRRMTDAVVAEIEVGRFADGAWVRDLLDTFARYYFDSIDGGVTSAPVPVPWVVAHAAAVGNDAAPLQLLLAGVNAHINYDLVLALVDVLDADWAVAGDDWRLQRRSDYELINEIIAATADQVQDEVVERRSSWLDVLDRGLGQWDERMAVRLLGRWRDRVWKQAVDLLEHHDPEYRTARIGVIEGQCARRARWLLL